MTTNGTGNLRRSRVTHRSDQHVALVTNVLSSYRVPCFRELSQQLNGGLTVFTLATDMEHRRYVLADELVEGIDVVPLRGFGFRKPPLDDRHLNDFLPVVKSRPTTIVLGGWDEPTYLLILVWAKARGIPVLFWIESTAGDMERMSRREAVKRRLLGSSAGCITPGRRAAEYCGLLGVSKDRIFTAPNATDRSYFGGAADELLEHRESLRRELGISGFTALFVGRLVESYKGVTVLIEACAQLHQGGESPAVIVVGDGPDGPKYRAMVKQHSLEGKIRFIGTLGHAELCKYYAAADVFVLPSHSETWGFVINEAMEFGLPIVASSQVGGAPDLVDERNGFIFADGDADDLAAKLRLLAGDADLRQSMGIQSREKIQEFSPEHWAEEFVKAIDQTSNRPPASTVARPVVFLNPWDRLIGPNRYLVEMLKADTHLASRAVVVLPPGSDAGEEYEELGCRVEFWREVDLVHPNLTLDNFRSMTRNHTLGLARVIARLRALQPEVVISNSENLWIGGLASRWLKVPHAQVFHTVIFDYRWSGHPRVASSYVRSLAWGCSKVIAVSGAVSDMLERFGVPASKLAEVPNSFDIASVQRSSCQPVPAGTLPATGPLLVSIGQLAHMKGQHVLIEAVARLRQTYPDITCVFVGRRLSDSGVEDTVAYEKSLYASIAALGLEANVAFVGEVEFVPALLAQADVYVHPSLTESFSRVVAEAMVCGCPVVATDVGGIPEVAGPGALLVAPEDAEALAAAIDKVLSSSDDRVAMARAAKEHISSHYDAKVVTAELSRLLDEMSSKRRQRPAKTDEKTNEKTS